MPRSRSRLAPHSSMRQHTFSMRQHTSACVSIRQHTSAYVSIRQHTSAVCVSFCTFVLCVSFCTCVLTAVCVSFCTFVLLYCTSKKGSPKKKKSCGCLRAVGDETQLPLN